MAWASAGYRPTQMTIACPACRGPALFRRACGLRLHSPEARARLAASPHFRILENDGHGKPIAVYRYGLGAPAPENLPELTPDEARTLPMDGPWPPHDVEGSVLCDTCGHRAPHRVNWPAEAFYQIEHRGQGLWAWHRAGAEAALRMAETPGMKPQDAPLHEDYLKRLPTAFFTAKARDDVARKLRRLLEGTP